MNMSDFLKMKKIREREIDENFPRPVFALELESADGTTVYQVLPELKQYREANQTQYNAENWPPFWTPFDPFVVGTLKHVNQSFDVDVGINKETDEALALAPDGESLEIVVQAVQSFAGGTAHIPIDNSYQEFSLHGQSYEVQILDPIGTPAMVPKNAPVTIRVTLHVENGPPAFFQQ